MVSTSKNVSHCGAVEANLLRRVYPQLREQKLLNVRRSLFGRTEPLTSSEVLNELFVKSAERASEEWNFDFSKDEPNSAGRFVWEKVNSCDLPLYYSMGEKSSTKQVKIDFIDISEECDQSSNGGKENKEFDLNQNILNETSKTEVQSLNTHFVQLTMKDFARIQKRPSSKRQCRSFYFRRGQQAHRTHRSTRRHVPGGVPS